MGEVYRARDTRLARTVAIKILPAHLSTRPELRERFEREARTIAALNHPNICSIFDVGSQDGVDYIVMEHLEGQTLAARLEKGPLPLEEALKVAVEIIDALDKAHRQGVVHRDLKPANIMLTKSGAKLLDFGLAKLALGPMSAPDALSQQPTAKSDSGLTAEGTILGTLQYMAPEQLEGQEADARSDIFAFGSVLYETITGEKAFRGKSKASLIASIIEHQPRPMSGVQPVTPAALDRIVAMCMAKDPSDRWQTAHDVAVQLKWIDEGAAPKRAIEPAAAPTKLRQRLAWGLMAAL
ncbi:MAG: serine/threonine protein kinase, partial [Acidobacteria bacterium]|nr:serine/threonine protein kinase [Acidobacteriota bacterium]